MAWCVTRTSPALNGQVTFDRILVNKGGIWNQSESKLTIPRDGYYVTHLSAGARQSHYLSYFLVVNRSQGNGGVYRFPASGLETIGHSVILRLLKDDQIIVQSDNPVYSDYLMQTSFDGFLIHEA